MGDYTGELILWLFTGVLGVLTIAHLVSLKLGAQTFLNLENLYSNYPKPISLNPKIPNPKP